MKKNLVNLWGLLFCAIVFYPLTASSQVAEVRNAVRADISIPLRDMKQAKKPFWEKWKRENEMEVPNKFRPVPPGFNPDGAMQQVYNNGAKAVATAPLVNFNGITNASNTGRVTPPDPAGDVGPNHYVQVVNSMLQIFSKTGTSLYGPVQTSTLWSGFSGNWDGHNNGDAIVLYDETADRWIITQFAIDCPGTPKTEYEMVAVSTTGDPTGSYYRYAFQFDYMPDYPKLGVWQDGYYMAVNRFNTNLGTTPFVGAGACVLERSKMLTGDASARMIYFKTETLGGTGSASGSACWSMLPSDCDGTLPAAGTPNYFTYINGTAQLRLWALHADWTTTTNSTFTYVTALTVASYTQMGSGSVPEMGTLSLDGLGDRLMFRNQYRNFGSYETFVTCHNVNTGSSVAGIRWYEYRKTGSAFSLYQQSTYAPGDGKSRWMGSIAMNASGDIGLAYSVSSSTMYPSIYFTGRKASDPLNQMTISEGIIQTGTVSMTSYSRWGDYSAMNVDPSDNTTFWTTQEYVGTYGGWCPWATKVASFKFSSPPVVTTAAATGITMTAATLNGTVNPNGVATTYYFQWGTSVSYGNNTATVSAGSGSSAIAVSANLTGLTSGTTYHFRLAGTNSDGTVYGSDLTFTPPLIPALIVGSINANQAICANATPAQLTGSGPLNGTSPTYQWQSSLNNLTFTNILGATALNYQPGALAASTYFRQLQNATGTTGGPLPTNTVTITINPILPVTVSVAASGNPVCTGTSVTFTASPVNGGTTPAYQWKVNGTNVTGATNSSYNFTPSDGNTISCILTSNAACISGNPATSNTVTMAVNPLLPVSVSIVASTNPICSGSAVMFTATPVNGGSVPAYQWKVNGASITGATNSLYAFIPANGAVITCTLSSNLACVSGNPATSNAITMVVNPALSVGSIGANQAICTNAIPAVLTGSGPLNGTNPTYQWQSSLDNSTFNNISGATSLNYQSGALTSTTYYKQLQNATGTCGGPLPTNIIALTVTPLLPVSLTIAGSANTVCTGTSVTFTATPVNGGTTPAYQWKVNGTSVTGATNSTYSFLPVNGNTITCILTSNATCTTGNPATSNAITMMVNPLLPASVSIAASVNPVCAGNSVMFTATPVNGGTTPAYQWKVNGTSVTGATNSTYSFVPANGNAITCTLTSNATCTTGNPASSNTITMTVNPLLPVSVSVVASAITVCAGTSVTFTATPVNGGTTPAYQWKVNGTSVTGATNSTYSFLPVNGNTITCILTSNATCTTGNPATSNAITMMVNPLLPASVSIAASVNPVCAGNSVMFTATPVNGGTIPAYQWKVNGTSVTGATNSTYSFVPVNGSLITCILTSNATCTTGNPATSNTVTMSVTPLLVVGSISANQTICANAIPAQLTGVAPLNGTLPTYQWQSSLDNNTFSNISGVTSLNYQSGALTSTTYYRQLQNATGTCGGPLPTNTVTITVNPLLPVSVSIVSSANPVCAGTSVTFTATPVNGGTTPGYQWKINGTSVAGATNATYSFVPANGNAISCMLTSNATCTTGNPATSNTVTMTVNPWLVVGSISANQSICANAVPVQLAGVAPLNGTLPTYQWQSSIDNITFNNISGATSLNYQPGALTTTTYYKQLQNAAGTCGGPLPTNSLTITVNPLLPVSVSIAASANTVCAGTSVTFTATPVNGGTIPAYQWKVNGTSVTGATNSTYAFVPVNGNAITCTLTSNATCTTGNPATSNTVTMTVNPLLPVSVSIAASAITVCAGTSVTFTASPVNGGTTPAYQWKVNGTSVTGATTSTYSFVPVNGNTITCILTSNATCTTGNPATSNTITITVNPLLPVSVSVAASAITVCAGTSVTFTATPVNGGTIPAYQWKVNGTSVTGATNSTYAFVPVNGNTITCLLTSNATCTTGNPATSNTVTMTVNPLLPVSVSIAASANTVCAGTSVTFTATPVNGGTTPAYQWKVNGTSVTGATTSTYSFVPVNGNTITCILTSNATCTTGNPATSNTITITVNPLLPVSVSVAASANPVCAGISVMFTATPVNGGTTPGYQWKVNGTGVTGATNSTYSFVPVNGSLITCVLTSNATCTTGNPATSNTVTMSVTPLLVVGSISANQTICANAIPAQLAGVAPLTGTLPTYQWQSSLDNNTFSNISGVTSLNYQSGTLTSTTYYRQLQNATATCGGPLPTNTVTITLNPLLPVSVSVAASANPVCAGTLVTFTATPVNGGTTPGYQWKINGTSITGATNSTYAFVPANGNMISCILASSETCTTGNPATSNTVTMTVNPLLPVSLSIAASANPVCAGTSVLFTATPVNGGTTPAYQWKVNGASVTGATNAAYSFVPANGNAITCILNSSEPCTTGNPATSNIITMTVNPLLPVSVSVSASANPVCAGTSVTFTATPVNGGTTPAYQWKVNGTSVTGATTATYSFIPANGNTIACILISNATCNTGNPATSNTVTMTVNPLLVVSMSLSVSANPVCAGTSVLFTATPVNGGTTPAYQWKVNGTNVPGATNSSYAFVPVNFSTISCMLTSSEPCTTANPVTSPAITMTVNPLLPVSVSIAASANPVCAGTSVTFTATPVNGGTTPAYQWKVNGTSVTGATTATYSFIPANGNTVACVLTSNATCTTGNPATSNTVTMTVNPLLPVSVSITASANPVCAGTSVTFTATPVNGGTTPAYQWKVNGTSVTGATTATYSFIPANGNTVACVLTSNATCTTGNPATSNTVNMTVNPLLPVSVSITASANPVCAGTSVTFTATPVNGGTSPAYQWKVNGTSVTGATTAAYSFIPANGNTIACVLTSNATCTTGNPATSNTVTMTVNPLLPVSVSIAASANPVCAGTSVTYSATPVNGGTIPAYQWKVNGTSVTGATAATYSFVPVNGNAITCVLTSNATCTTGNPATSNTVTMTVNPLLPVSVSIAASANPVCAGTSVTYAATPVNGGSTPSFQWKVNGTSVTGATNSAYSFVPVNGNAITCVLTSNATCTTGNPATSNTVTMTVNPLLPVSVSIAASANPVCAGTSVTYSATAVNGGSTPSFQWKVNGTSVTGATTSSYSFIPASGNAVSCTLTSNATCTTGNPATSNTITMTVNPLLPVSVSIAASANPVCAGTSVTFSATPVNGGTTPSFQWKVNGTSVTGATTSSYSFIPASGNAVSCTLTSNATCTTGNPATSNSITMMVNPVLPVSVSITASANPVCAGTSVTFSATPVNGGTTPSFQWKVNGTSVTGATTSSYSFIPASGNAVSCALTSNINCTSGNPATSNSITMMINPLRPVSISITASANPVCAGTSVTFSATPVNGGTTPSFQWKVNGTNITGATTSSYSFIPASGNAVSCSLTSNINCTSGNPATSNTITMMVNPVLPVSISIAASANPVLAGTSVTFTATPVNGGTSPGYQWKVGGTNVTGATNASYAFIPVNGNTITCLLLSNATCTTGNPATSNSVTMSVTTVAATLVLQNLNVTGTQCFNATQTITVAGGSTTFTVQSGGSATMIAGLRISYLPGTAVKSGGYMHGYITTTGQYCGTMAPSLATVVEGEETIAISPQQSFFRVYPNPTTGLFVVDLSGQDPSENIRVKIYSMTGEKIMTTDFTGEGKHELSLSGRPAGIYLIHVVSGQNAGTTRIIKK